MARYNIPDGPSMASSFFKSFEMVKRPIDVVLGNLEQYGDTYGVKAGLDKYIIVTRDPGFIEHVLKKNHKNYAKSSIVAEKLGRFLGNGLLTSNGEYWLRQRRLIQPGFHKQKLQALYQVMQHTIDDFVEKFPVGQSVDVYPQTNRLAFEVVINSLFNIAMPEGAKQELADIISEVQEFIVKDIRQPYKYLWFVLSGTIRQNMFKSDRARDIIREIIRQRKSSGTKVGDLLDMLLDARYEDTGEPMTEAQLIDEILILIVAGHETSANALAWALFLLARHPHELEKLRSATSQLNIDEAVSNRQLAATIKETMRLYPPAWITDREALYDDSYGNYSFPAGTNVVMFFYGVHLHPSFWDNPLEFKPSRFANENAEKLVSGSYYPFGAGPRFCIGSGFAMAEMALFLKSFINTFDIKPTAKKPSMIPLVTLRPDEVILDVARRK